jgi:hypothetical protein
MGSPWHGTGLKATNYARGDEGMTTLSEIERRREALVKRGEEVMRELQSLEMAQAEAEDRRVRFEEAMELFGEDVYEAGAVITFSRLFPSGGRYHYAALKAGGSWWLTGKTDYGMSWRMLVERYLRHSDDAAYVETVMPIV